MEEKVKSFLNSKTYVRSTFLLVVIVVLSATFLTGVQVGLHKARYSSQWGANYEKNFIGRGPGMMISPQDFFGNEGGRGKMGPRGGFPDFDGRGFRNPHGTAGQIISVGENSLVVKDRDNKENTVSISSKSIIKFGMDSLKITDLKSGQNIVVIGKPNEQGTIEADLIRIFPDNLKNQNNFPQSDSQPSSNQNQ